MDSEPTMTGSSAPPRDRAELLERIRSSRAALEATISPLSEAQLTSPGPGGGWSVRDHLAHIAAWERFLLALIHGTPRNEAMDMDEASYKAADTDGINEWVYRRNRDRPLPEVLDGFYNSHQQVMAALDGMAEADLLELAPYAHDPDDPTDEWVACNTYEHYMEHQVWIQALLDQGGQK